MKFSIGDAVLLKRTGEEGHIVSFLSKTLIEVAVNGVQFPVYEDEVDHPYLKWFTEKKAARPKQPAAVDILPEKIKDRKARLAQGIYLSFVPVFIPDSFEDIVTHFRVFLLNETAAAIFFTYEVRNNIGRQVFQHQAALHPFGNLYLHPQTLEEMNEQPRFHWKLRDAQPANKLPGVQGTLRIKPARLFEHITRLLEANEPAFNYLLADDASGVPAPVKPVETFLAEKQSNKESQGQMPAWKPVEVLDLHIEMLVDKPEELSPAEILLVQLSALDYHVDMAIAHCQQSMFIIHGIGKGTLRDEVHGLLKGKRGIDRFEHKWHGLYGFGATEVIFK